MENPLIENAKRRAAEAEKINRQAENPVIADALKRKAKAEAAAAEIERKRDGNK